MTVNSKPASKRKTKYHNYITIASFRAGWEDGMLKAPYRRVYETMRYADQCLYEHGRAAAFAYAEAAPLKLSACPRKIRLDWETYVKICAATAKSNLPPSANKIAA